MDMDLNKEIKVTLTLGHMIMAWDVISNRISGFLDGNFSEEEKRTIWALEDILERALASNNVTGSKPGEWEKLVKEAAQHIKTLPVDFTE